VKKKRQTKEERYPLALPMLNAVIPGWEAELQFYPGRKFRFDWANRAIMLAIECDGSVWTGGRHSGGIGQIRDMEKGRLAIEEGWSVAHFTPQQVNNGDMITWVGGLIKIYRNRNKLLTIPVTML
jgi:hypothetical protein